MPAKKENLKRQLLKGVDDLLESPSVQPDTENSVVKIPISKLTHFSKHPFSLYDGERLDDMVSSIENNGVIVPVAVRSIGTKLEILSGHNRVNAASKAGLDVVPTIIYDNISDEEAMAIVVETNLNQRSFADMSHSERAAVLALQHSKMFSQGKRNDIIEQQKSLDKPLEQKENKTSSQIANQRKTASIVGAEHGLSKDTVARYLRIEKLIPELKEKLDDGKIAFIPCVSLSYLSSEEQEHVDFCIENESASVDMVKAGLLRQSSEKSKKGKLTETAISEILSGKKTKAAKPDRVPTIKLSKDVYSKYFKSTQPAKEVQSIVEEALEMYFASKSQ